MFQWDGERAGVNNESEAQPSNPVRLESQENPR